MRNILLLIILVTGFHISFGQNSSTVYDSVLAHKLGADEYGMRQYVMAFLKPGPQAGSIDSIQRAKLIKGHLKNIGRLAKEGKLLIAGPFMDKGPYAGIFIFDVPTTEEARKLVSTDPAVQAGIFDMELHTWYGSAALMQIPSVHPSLQKKNILE